MLRLLLMSMLLIIPSTALGQITDVKKAEVRALMNIKDPVVVKDANGQSLVLLDKDAKVVDSKVLIVSPVTAQKNVSVIAWTSAGFLSVTDVVSAEGQPREFIISGDLKGKVFALVTAFDPGLYQRTIDHDFAPPPKPDPDKPDNPDPPKPDPTLPTEFDKIAERVKGWSVGLPKKSEVAAIYRKYGAKLTDGNSGLATINTISAEMVAERNTLLGADGPAYVSLITNLNTDLAARWPLSKGVLALYWNCIAAGLEAK